MPAFTTLSEAEVDSIAASVMSLKAPASPTVPAQQTTPVHGDIQRSVFVIIANVILHQTLEITLVEGEHVVQPIPAAVAHPTLLTCS